MKIHEIIYIKHLVEYMMDSNTDHNISNNINIDVGL